VETRVIKVEAREEVGSSAVKRLRKGGFAPAVVYSGGEVAKSITVDTKQIKFAVRGARPTQVFSFESEDKSLDGTKAFIKSVQISPLKEELLHVDFLSIKEGQKVVIDVELELVGSIAAVRSGDAVLEQRVYALSVECLPEKIPARLTVDISHLEVGDSISASEVELPSGAVLRSNAELTVVSVTTAVLAAAATPAVAAVTPVAAPATPAKAAAKPAGKK
jgi:large subunit ribosomal protein L25